MSLSYEYVQKFSILQEQLKSIKAEEMKMRLAIVDAAKRKLESLKKKVPESGTVKILSDQDENGECFEIAIGIATTTEVDEDSLTHDWPNLDEDVKECFEVVEKFKFKKVIYKAKKQGLDEGEYFEADDYITVKPAAPSVKIK